MKPAVPTQPALLLTGAFAVLSRQRMVAWLLGWYPVLVLGVACGAFYANLPIYAYILYPAVLPKFWFFGIFALILPWMVIHYRSLGAYLISPFVLWAILFFILNLIHLSGFSATADLGGVTFIESQVEARRALIMTRAQYIVFAIFLGFIACTTTKKSYLYVIVILMLVVPCTVILDFAQPGLLYPVDTPGAVLGRAGAMFINPTIAGEAILHVFLLGCAVTPVKWRVPLFLVAGAGILMTFSRSSIIGWLLILPLLAYHRTLPRSALATVGIVALSFCLVFLSAFQSYLDSRSEFDGAASNIVSRLNFFSSFKFDDDSSEERADVIKGGWELFLRDPVFGAGAGATLFWSHRGSTHNQLLLLAAEYGMFGVGLWIWLLIILCRGKYFEDKGLQMAMAFLFALMSMFTHSMFDASTYWLATFALISVRPKPPAN